MKWRIAACAALVVLGSSTFLSQESNEPLRQPLVKNGRYYYSENDTHDHMAQVMKYLPKKLVRFIVTLPIKLVTKFISFFNPKFGQKKEDTIPLHVKIPEPIQSKPDIACTTPTITWIGHSSFLIQINQFNILTDPVFGDIKAGPITVSKRNAKPGISLKDLPPIDAVLISHDHADHTDSMSLKYIAKKFPHAVACVPLGNKKLMRSFGFKQIKEKTWWEHFELQKDNRTLTVTCLPAKHWSQGFSLTSYRKSLWASWMISANNSNIYFAGDSGYEDHFEQIAHKFRSIDAAIIGIGPTFEHGNCQGHDHTDAREAIEAFITLRAKTFIPMHFLTFFKCPDKYERPVNVMYEYWNKKQNQLHGKRLLFAQIGKQYTL